MCRCTLRCSLSCLVLGTLFALVAVRAQAADPVDADVVLEGGTIFDGTGVDGVVGDVAIKGSRIAAVGRFERGAVGRVIDCRGLVVAPGFIDLHSHSDRGITDPDTRGNVNFITQGCTTVVTGNCGGGPINVAEYFERVDVAGAGTNVIHLLPQGALRSNVMGTVRRKATPEEVSKMRQLAEQAMRDGAWGMSTGLIYVPGTYTETDEIVEIARIVAAHGGLYASHIRNENTGLLDAVREAIEIGQRAGLPVHISHFKASGRSAWGSLRAAAVLIEQARKTGQRVTADQYPYIASSTSLQATVIPGPAREGGQKAMLARLDDPEQGPKLRAEIAATLGERDKLFIASYGDRPDWIGKSVAEIAQSEGKEPLEIVIEIERHGGASIVNFGMDEEEVRFAMQLPWVATGSDGSTRVPSADRPHPRSYGTFSRKIGLYAQAEKVIPLAQAIRSASGLPADILELTDRGYLKPQAFADIAVFDPASFRDQATFEEPFRYSSGIRYVFVNGRPALHDGTPTGVLAGRALRHTAKGGG
jgi:N-acyl-D-amino-acid deacylase